MYNKNYPSEYYYVLLLNFLKSFTGTREAYYSSFSIICIKRYSIRKINSFDDPYRLFKKSGFLSI